MSDKGKFLQRYPLDVLIYSGVAAEIGYGKNVTTSGKYAGSISLYVLRAEENYYYIYFFHILSPFSQLRV